MSMNSETTEALGLRAGSSREARGGAIEPWFAILLSSLAPLLGGLFGPDAWRTPLHVLGGVLCAVGLVLLVRHEIAVREDRIEPGP
jgi:hypothetical protein